MIGWIKSLIATNRRARLIKECQTNGHVLCKSGELSPAVMGPGGIPLANGSAEFWIYGCPCGYNEVDVPLKKPYRRSWKDGEGFKKKGEYSVKAKKSK